MEDRKKMISWIKDHENELILAGIAIGTLALLFWQIKNHGELQAVWNYLRKLAKKPTVRAAKTVANVTADVTSESFEDVITAVASNSDSFPFEVRSHIRNLPDGWHASPEKISEALNCHVILVDGQTWVDSYTKRGVTA